jgi:transcriptional regulator GlxA family with amidase domain
MRIAIVLFDGITILDAIGPYQVLSRVPGAEVRFVAPAKGRVVDQNRLLHLEVEHDLAETVGTDILLVPGGPGVQRLLKNRAVLDNVIRLDADCTWTTSVCTGSLVLAAAGLLAGRRATTHWNAVPALEMHGAAYAAERWVVDGKYVTAAGVSAGIDMALWLADELAGPDSAKAIQLSIEYDPAPPFDAGTPSKAGEGITAALRKAMEGRNKDWE